MRSLNVLAPATAKADPATAAAEPGPQPAAPTGPERTRETASDGYRRALAAHQEAAPHRVDRSTADAVEQQTAAMCALSAQAFPETVVPDE
ncbi:hypothetical protein [Streptomyces sp. NPDC017991]|uniref:hypothetical protein n=1 Tax=Streptomyces sp. NPDC017991 TaxID=3365026 RepID=UPI0037A5B320